MIQFSKRLKELRTENKILQKDLAKVLGVQQNSVSGWENGSREPDFAMLEKIAVYFNVTTDYLLGIKDD